MNFPALYEQVTHWIGDGTGASDALLHVHAGMAVLFLARIITGRSLATWVPFSFVVAAELTNEVIDRLYYGTWRFPDTIYDVINTLFWPLMLMMGLRIRRSRELRTAGETQPS